MIQYFSFCRKNVCRNEEEKNPKEAYTQLDRDVALLRFKRLKTISYRTKMGINQRFQAQISQNVDVVKITNFTSEITYINN
ncbi:MAG: hypothetical protein BWZ03_00007 [bacterium ADurb.BinA186]|nr:MAG: hypothetical protein BWZ03_00007 [bacterium ADurb.BinA186]